jgi:tRNA(fMet)-specific endonuclease VapC
MGTLLDTSILIDIERGRGAIPTTAATAIAAITASELLQGVLRADRAHRTVRESFVEGILAMLPTIPFSLQIARVHARIWADLAAARVTVDAVDLEVAATTIALGWELATLNRKDFARIAGLRLARLP